MPKKQQKPNSLVPWDCVIVGIDPGAEWGAGCRVQGEEVFSNHGGVVNTTPRDMVIETACNWSISKKIPLIFIIEQPLYHRRGKGHWGPKQYEGFIYNKMFWTTRINNLGKISRWKSKTLEVNLSTWRSAIYGHCVAPKTHFDKKKRELVADPNYWKQLAIARYPASRNHNEAEACAIAEFGCYWWKVGEQAGVKPYGA